MEKIILVTGASSGFGKEIASYLAKEGHIVYGTSRKKNVEAEFQMLELDVLKKETIKHCIETIIEKHGKIDVLINNAGMGIGGCLELATEEEIQIQINTNLIGTINVCSEVLPYFRKQKNGRIINISSIAGIMGIPYQGLYSVSKFGIEGYSETLALEVAKFNIKVVLVEPGDFQTGFTASRIISEATLNSETYGESFKKTLEIIEKEENNGLKPIVLAKKINSIINKKHPRFRYPVANFEQRLSILAKKLLPARLFHKILRSFYKM